MTEQDNNKVELLTEEETIELNSNVEINNQENIKQTEKHINTNIQKRNSFLIGLCGGVIGALVVTGGALLLNSTMLKNNKSYVPTSTISSTAPSTSEDTSVENAVSAVQDAIVSILNYQKTSTNSLFGFSRGDSSTSTLNKASEGSGVIYKVDNDTAYIVTNNHVIENADELQVQLHSGETVKAELVGSDTLTDLAVLRISSENVKKVAAFADSANVKVGQTALAIGSPLGTELASSVTKGIVSAVNRSVSLDTNNDKVEDWSMQTIQTDAAINPGNSGGALVDLNGNIIGINSMKISNTAVEGIGFAIPSNDVVSIINELEQNGKVIRPILGVNTIDLSEISTTQKQNVLNLDQTLKDGVVITNVQNNSSADKAGLKKYDVITSWNNTPITSSLDLRKQLYSSKIGDKVELEIYRNGQKQKITITISETKDL